MSVTGLILIIANLAFSYKGFSNAHFFKAHAFEVGKIRGNKEYKRLITSGFLHNSWTELIVNMASLYFFSRNIEWLLGGWRYLLIYFSSLLGGNLLSLFVHRLQHAHRAVGASGAVCGIIFASIALVPGHRIDFFGLPFSIPGWFYGILYMLYSMFGMRSNRYRAGHDLLLGAAITGMIVALFFSPSAFAQNSVVILGIALPALIYILLIIIAPQWLVMDPVSFPNQQRYYSVDHRYNVEKSIQQTEVDRILEKIGKRGMDSLTRKEKGLLKEYSRKIQ